MWSKSKNITLFFSLSCNTVIKWSDSLTLPHCISPFVFSVDSILSSVFCHYGGFMCLWQHFNKQCSITLPRMTEDLTDFSLSVWRSTAFYLINTETHLHLSKLKKSTECHNHLPSFQQVWLTLVSISPGWQGHEGASDNLAQIPGCVLLCFCRVES